MGEPAMAAQVGELGDVAEHEVHVREGGGEEAGGNYLPGPHPRRAEDGGRGGGGEQAADEGA